jgi:hypothetical protein
MNRGYIRKCLTYIKIMDYFAPDSSYNQTQQDMRNYINQLLPQMDCSQQIIRNVCTLGDIGCWDELETDEDKRQFIDKWVQYEFHQNEHINRIHRTNKWLMARNNNNPLTPKISSPFILYANQHREQLAHQYPDMSFGDVGRMLGEMWRDADAHTKNVYYEIRQLLKREFFVCTPITT